MPDYRFPEMAVRALALAADRRDWLARPLGQAPSSRTSTSTRRGRSPRGSARLSSTPSEAEALLAAAGIDVLHAELCADPDAAVRAAAAAGGPVALKAGRDEVVGGLEGDGRSRAGWHELVRRAGASGILVQRLAEPGVDAVLAREPTPTWARSSASARAAARSPIGWRRSPTSTPTS